MAPLVGRNVQAMRSVAGCTEVSPAAEPPLSSPMAEAQSLVRSRPAENFIVAVCDGRLEACMGTLECVHCLILVREWSVALERESVL